MSGNEPYEVIIVGGGFAGVACAKELADHNVRTVLIDKHNYHQFQPLLYQVATAQLGVKDIARSLRAIFRHDDTVDIKTGKVESIDVEAKSVTTIDGVTFSGDILVIAGGAQPNFFNTPGAAEHAFPLYSVDDADRMRSHILGAFDATDRNADYIEKGGVNFVIVGGGATGVETAGALSEFINHVMPHFYPGDLADAAKVYLVDRGHVVLNGFSDRAHAYARKRLEDDGVELRLGRGVQEVEVGRVVLDDGSEIATRTVIWAGGEMAFSALDGSGLPQGRGGRVDVTPELAVRGVDGVYVVGDAANITGHDGKILPQLGSVAQQSGACAGANIVADLAGTPRKAFHYRDKGIMAMIGKNAAVAEMGAHRHEVDGPIAFGAWLGVHAMLLSGTRRKVDAFISWGWDYFSVKRPNILVDRPEAYVIDWSDDE